VADTLELSMIRQELSNNISDNDEIQKEDYQNLEREDTLECELNKNFDDTAMTKSNQ
jgi:hypothetical protein